MYNDRKHRLKGRSMITGGKLITFEGIDGCGKSTQLALLAESLERDRIPFRLTREPGGTAVGEAIRKILLTTEHDDMDPLAELLLFEAARAQLVRDLIRPALAAGELVLLDRFVDSTVAYQGYGRGLGAERVRQLNTVATSGLMPHRTFLLDLPAEAAAARVQTGRTDKQDRLDAEGTAFMKVVRMGYLAIAEQEPERVTVIDATESIQTVAADLYDKLREEIKL